MLRFLRKYSSSTGIKILYGLLASLFVIWGVGAIGGDRVDNIAEVHGQAITRRDLERTTLVLQRRYEQMMQGRFTPDLARSLDLPSRALDQLVEDALMRHEAKRLGISVTEAELIDYITHLPELQEGGRFSRERLEAFLQAERDRGEFEGEIRRALLSQRLQSLVTDGVQVTDGEVEDRYRLDHEQAKLAYVRIAAADHAQGVTLSDEDLERSLNERADRYRVSTRVRVRYAAYRPADFLAQSEMTDGEVAEYYELNKEDRFTEPEQVRARHILIKTAPDASDDAKVAARTKAEGLLAKVRGGGDFGALAKKHSDDPGSAAQGGDLGLFPRGRMTPAFESAAFALEPGQVSDLVETPFGFHIIKVEEHRLGGLKPLDAVRDEILQTLRKDRSLELARKQAEEDRRKVVKGQSLADAVSPRPLEETPAFTKDEPVPGIGRAPEFSDTAFALTEKEVSDLIETEDAIYLLTPFERIEAHTPALADVRERVLADARRERAEAAGRERAEKLLARAREVGLEAAATEAGAKLEQTGAFERRGGAVPGLGGVPQLATDAFTLTAEAPLAPKVYAVGGDSVVAALRERIPANMAGLAEAKNSLQDSMLQRKRQAVLTEYIDFLKQRAVAEGALEVRSDAVTRG